MRATKGIHLWLRKPRKGHSAIWIIRDGSRQKSTGCGPREVSEAEQKLAIYIASRHKPQRACGCSPSQIAVADVTSLYFDNVAERRSRPDEIRRRFANLNEFFGDKMLSEITKASCRAYAKSRGHAQAARRELEDMRAAINHYFAEESVRPTIHIELPEKAIARDRWLTVQEAARLLRTAWRKTQPTPNGGIRYVARHIARFILVGLYTGTRSAAICGAAIRPTVGRGYVDLERGVFYRRAPGTKETTKRQPPVRLPSKLLAHLRRWERLGICRKYIIEWEGLSVKRVSKGFVQVAKEARLEGVTPHSLRHSAISWGLQRGISIWEAADFFGVSERILTKVYAHHSEAHQNAVASKMDRRKK